MAVPAERPALVRGNQWRRQPRAERFWARVARGDGCWLWQGQRNPVSGYGAFYDDDGSMVYAHRLAFELAYGPVGKLWVLHRCDNPPCCRPEHLFKGTSADNIADMVAKGRQGDNTLAPTMMDGRAKKLDAAARDRIAEALAAGVPKREIARWFGVRSQAIDYYVRRWAT